MINRTGYHDRLPIPPEISQLFEVLLAKQGVPINEYLALHKWLRFYLDFCNKYRLEPFDKRNFAAFDQKLSSKYQSENQRKQARRAIVIYYRGIAGREMPGIDKQPEIISQIPPAKVPPSPIIRSEASGLKQLLAQEMTKTFFYPPQHNVATNAVTMAEPVPQEIMPSNSPVATEEIKLTGADWIWVYDKLKSAIQIRYYSPKTLGSYKGLDAEISDVC